MTVDLRHGNCLDILPTLPDCSVDSIVTDPPYELGFMGKKWDNSGIAYNVTLWQECLRVLKPGGHLLAFGGTRTYHRMACAIEDAGFEIRDSIHWLYGSGFPKSLDVSKAIDKQRDDSLPSAVVAEFLIAQNTFSSISEFRQYLNKNIIGDNHSGGSAQGWTTKNTNATVKPRVPTWDQWLELKSLLGFGDEMDAEVWRLNGRKGQPGEAWAEREIIGKGKQNMTEASVWATEHGSGRFQVGEKEWDITAPATEQAKQWAGWGTALKPAHESVIVARKGSHIGLDFSPVPILEVSQWLLSSANDALTSSTSNRAEWLAAMFDSVPRLAEQHPATPADLFEVTAMWLSAWATPMTLNTVSLWLNIWEEAWQRESMSTTSTASRTTTGLRTWRFLLSQITPENTPRSVTSQGGEQSLAWLAVETLSDVLLNLSDIHGLPVPESATDLWQELFRVEVASETHEPIVVARKPLVGTVASNVLEFGTGAINIDGSRIGMSDEDRATINNMGGYGTEGWVNTTSPAYNTNNPNNPLVHTQAQAHHAGRWPANVILTHTEDCTDECVPGCPVALLDEQSGTSKDGVAVRRNGNQAKGLFGVKIAEGSADVGYGGSGGASRFFYCAKPSRRERNAGLNHLQKPDIGGVGIRSQNPEPYEERTHEPDPAEIAAYLKHWREKKSISKADADKAIGGSTLYSWFEGRPKGIQLPTPEMWWKLKELFGFDETHDAEMTQTHLVEKSGFENSKPAQNHHPTVKPLALMRYLVRLVTPPNGTVLEPFAGSGTTLMACVLEGFDAIGIEMTDEYLPIIQGRIAWAEQQTTEESPQQELQL